MIEIIKEKKAWNDLLALAKRSDFYHTYYYHHLSKKEEELPVLFKYTQEDTCIALPLLIRKIDNSIYRDATSVYGYSGLVTINKGRDFDLLLFQEELKAFLETHRIITVFSRLHPFIDDQETFLSGMGTITNPGNVVFIDLKNPLEIQRQKFSRRLKTYLNKSRKLCSVVKGRTEEDVRIFMDLYFKNMKRVNADAQYFFTANYFYKLMMSSEFKTELLLCVHNETKAIIGGAMFIKKGNIVQYHLSGLDECYFSMNPIKLIIDEMRIKATREGYDYFNLGGGRGSKKDTLFAFKSSFSKNFKPFKLWKFVVNEEAYSALVNSHHSILDKKTSIDEAEYFPAYRSAVKTAI